MRPYQTANSSIILRVGKLAEKATMQVLKENTIKNLNGLFKDYPVYHFFVPSAKRVIPSVFEEVYQEKVKKESISRLPPGIPFKQAVEVLHFFLVIY